MSSYQGNLVNNLSLSDIFYSFSQRNHIVSPYSSLLALVNKRQMQELRNESRKSNRYLYEVRDMRISRWKLPVVNLGIEAKPQESPIGNKIMITDLVTWFIILNIVIIIFAFVVYAVFKYIKKHSKKT